MHIRRSLQLTCLLLALCHFASAANYPRQGPGGGGGAGNAPAEPPADTSRTSSTSSASSTTSEASSTTSNTSATTSNTSTTPTTTATTPTTPAQPTNTQANTPPPVVPPQGSTVIQSQTDTETVTSTSTGTGAAASQTKTKPPDEAEDPSPGLGTGSIVGMSVAGGLALIGIVAFFVWKFTRKRGSFDDNEAIKWPDLNSHSATGGLDSQSLPPRDTARSGFDPGSDPSLAKLNSDNYSTPDFNAGDPYAVPPLPHLNPNQPYRDDPTAPSGYYDPYRGPVPGTMENGSDWHGHGGEAIPMNQIHGGAPVYDQVGFEQPPYNSGRASPGPHAAYNTGRASPGPHAAYNTGRASPGPHMAYQQGYDSQPPYTEAPPVAGRQSPGPQAAYAGRMSPGPNVAYHNTGYSQAAPSYDGYGQR